MNRKVESIDYNEPISITVGRYLSSKEFGIADEIGLARLLTKTNSLGILYKDPDAKPRKYLFGLIKLAPRRVFIGIIYFKNTTDLSAKRSWDFKVYGRDHIEMVKQLAEEIAQTFKVKINISLVSEESRVEFLLSDFG